MGSSIRPANAADAPEWLDLVRTSLGNDYPAKEVYDIEWIATQLDPNNGCETWVAEVDGRLQGTISFLKPEGPNDNPVANLGRNLIRPESVANGSADMLMRSVNELTSQRGEMAVVRISALDNAQQILFENLGYVVRRIPAAQALVAAAGGGSVLCARGQFRAGHPQFAFRIAPASQRTGHRRAGEIENPQHNGGARRRLRLPVAMRIESA